MIIQKCGQNNHAVPFESHADGPNTQRQREVRYRMLAKEVIINRNIGLFSSVALKLHVLSYLVPHLPSVNLLFFSSLYIPFINFHVVFSLTLLMK